MAREHSRRAADRLRVIALLFCVVIPLSVLAQESPPEQATPDATDAEKEATLDDERATLQGLSLLGEVLSRVKQDHYDNPKVHQLVEGAIRGVLETLDPYSQYYDPDAYRELQTETYGKFGGLGMYIGVRDDRITVISPIEDTPAFRAGILAGDVIAEIDGESTSGMTADEAARKMRGEPGTDVTLTIVREGVDEPITVPITRDIITITSVKVRHLDDDVGYIRITQFMQPTADSVGEALDKLSSEGVESLILDLRSNPGGLLSSAVEVASYFLNEGDLVVYTQGRQKREDYVAVKKSNRTTLPLVVLVDRGSASASEIVSGALQAHRRAIVMGQQTFGKASVQKIFPLKEGDRASAIKLTIAHYYTPDGSDIHNVGITPDVTLTGWSPLETRMWRRVRSSAALKEFLKGEDPDVLKRLEGLRREKTVSPLRRKYQTFINALEKDNIVLSDRLLKYAIASETLGNELDNYEYDPQIQSAVQYLHAFKSFRRLRFGGETEGAATEDATP